MPLWDPYKLIFDNGMQFDIKDLREFCEALGIKKDFSACRVQSDVEGGVEYVCTKFFDLI